MHSAITRPPGPAQAAGPTRRAPGSSSPALPARAAPGRPRARDLSAQVFMPGGARGASASASPATASRDGEAGGGARQTYIQESISFTSAELAARLPSMQAARRAREQAAAPGGARAGAAAPSRLAAGAAAPAAFVPPAAAAAAAAAYSTGGAAGGPYSAAAIGAGGAGARMGGGSMATSPLRAYGVSPTSGFDYGGTVVPRAAASADVASAPAPAPLAPPPAEVSLPPLESSLPPPQPAAPQPPPPPAAPAPPPLPGAAELAGLSAREKLEALQAASAVSRQALVAASAPASPYYANAPKTIDIRMYDQLVVAHNKLSKRLGESNAHIDVVEAQLARSNSDLMAAYELLKQVAMEFGTTSRLAASTAAAVQFGVDPQDALDKISKLQERLSTLEQAVLEQRQEFGLRVARQVPVEWIGVASEVRVMGDFDDWTRGHELSAEDVTSDSVYSRFEGTLTLRPGSYRVKFLVDNEWRLAADWPTEDDEEGNTVNVLTVA
ncbi:hypothetical protein HT031_000553 [Scenedesmus sp. PABB004]|nr:hypothetical protein HT031_000553 [Scenedesmus sp. PABB004]